MFYDEEKTITHCDEDPSVIFALIKEDCIFVIDKILSRKSFNINVVDEDGNSVLMKLLKKGYYKVVLKHMKDKNWDVNHQNNDGDTFGHLLFMINDTKIIELVKELMKNKNFSPNIRNNAGDTILDISTRNSYIYGTIKILENKKFNNIGLLSLKNLYKTYIKTNKYGRYTKLNNFDMIIDSLSKKEVTPVVKEIINVLKDNYEIIKEEFINNKTDRIDFIFKSVYAI